ncbi:10857_t:CDS:2, partial [Paraglomus occultum]
QENNDTDNLEERVETEEDNDNEAENVEEQEHDMDTNEKKIIEKKHRPKIRPRIVKGKTITEEEFYSPKEARVTEEQWEDMKEAMELLVSDWEFIISEARTDKLLKQLQRNERELLRFEGDSRFPATEVNNWLQTVRGWINNLHGEISLSSGNNRKRKVEKSPQSHVRTKKLRSRTVVIDAP